jgi:hypothetical protein
MRRPLLAATAALLVAVSATGAEAGCTIYEHSELGGDRSGLSVWNEFLDGGDQGTAMSGEAVAYLGEGWNDTVSSVRVTRGCALTLYEHAGFGGASVRFGPGTHDLADTWWNDRATGARCTCQR